MPEDDSDEEFNEQVHDSDSGSEDHAAADLGDSSDASEADSMDEGDSEGSDEDGDSKKHASHHKKLSSSPLKGHEEVTISDGTTSYVFERHVKYRKRGSNRHTVEVEFLLRSGAESEKQVILRNIYDVKKFLENKDIDENEAARFDFGTGNGKADTEAFHKSQSKGRSFKGGSKRKAAEPRKPTPSKKSKLLSGDLHPLSKCFLILEELRKKKSADIFNSPVDTRTVLDYRKVVEKPMDLGTIVDHLVDGLYQTAHDVRKDVTLVWKNCILYNGIDSPLATDAFNLAKFFDERFKEEIVPPQHQGMKDFSNGEQWVGKKVEVFWFDDQEWYLGMVVGYDKERQNGCYKIKYNDDEEEWIDLPDHDVAITDNWDGMADQLAPWEGAASLRSAGLSTARPQRARQHTKLFAPSDSSYQNKSKSRKSAEMKTSHPMGEAPPPAAAAAAAAAAAGDVGVDSFDVAADKVASGFVCDDGLPCGEVCRCRFLFW